MKIWIVTIGEPTLLDSKNPRLLRSAILANKLTEKEIDVTFFNSTFDHTQKKHRFSKNTEIKHKEFLKYFFLKSTGYKKNISLLRLIDHFFIARNFKKVINKLALPDLIFCSMPTIELAYYSAKFAEKNRIPLIIDIRDLWPDNFYVNKKNKFLKFIFKSIFAISNSRLKYALSNCSSITGITDSFVSWGESKTKKNKYLNNQSFFLTKPFKPNSKENLNKARIFWDKLGVNEDDFNISLCGSFSSVLDFDSIIQSAAILSKKKINVKFILCGIGDLLEDCKKKASGLKNILFPGWIDNPQIEILMLRSKFGILPYRNFFDFKMSIPNKVSEYFSYGLPLLTCLKGDVEKLILKHNCGVIYKESDPLDLSKKIIYQLENYDSFRYKEKSLDLYNKKFKADKIYENMCNHIFKINRDFNLREQESF